MQRGLQVVSLVRPCNTNITTAQLFGSLRLSWMRDHDA